MDRPASLTSIDRTRPPGRERVPDAYAAREAPRSGGCRSRGSSSRRSAFVTSASTTTALSTCSSNVRPITAAACTVRRAPSGRRSSPTVINYCTVSGIDDLGGIPDQTSMPSSARVDQPPFTTPGRPPRRTAGCPRCFRGSWRSSSPGSPASGERVDQRPRSGAVPPLELDRRRAVPELALDPRRNAARTARAVGSERDRGRHRTVVDQPDRLADELQGRLIAPVEVLEHDQPVAAEGGRRSDEELGARVGTLHPPAAARPRARPQERPGDALAPLAHPARGDPHQLGDLGAGRCPAGRTPRSPRVRGSTGGTGRTAASRRTGRIARCPTRDRFLGASSVQRALGLLDESALADPGVADEQHHRAPDRVRTLEGGAHDGRLLLATDQRRLE